MARKSGSLSDRQHKYRWRTTYCDQFRAGCASTYLWRKDRQIIVRHLQDDTGHGGAEFGADFAVAEAAVAALFFQQHVADGGVPLGPVVAAGVPHGLYGVILAVEEIAVVASVPLGGAGDV